MKKIVAGLLVLASSTTFVSPTFAQADAASKTLKVAPCNLLRDPVGGKKYTFLSQRIIPAKKTNYRVFTYSILEAGKKYYEYVVVDGEKVTALATITPSYPKVNGIQKTVLNIKTCGQAGVGVTEAPTIKTSLSNRVTVMYGAGADRVTVKGKVGFSTNFGLFQIGDRDI
jgi:hypothetical protein